MSIEQSKEFRLGALSVEIKNLEAQQKYYHLQQKNNSLNAISFITFAALTSLALLIIDKYAHHGHHSYYNRSWEVPDFRRFAIPIFLGYTSVLTIAAFIDHNRSRLTRKYIKTIEHNLKEKLTEQAKLSGTQESGEKAVFVKSLQETKLETQQRVIRKTTLILLSTIAVLGIMFGIMKLAVNKGHYKIVWKKSRWGIRWQELTFQTHRLYKVTPKLFTGLIATATTALALSIAVQTYLNRKAEKLRKTRPEWIEMQELLKQS